MKYTLTEKHECPACKRTLDAHLHTDGLGRGPAPDDLSVCHYCGALLIFLQDMALRLVTDQEFARLPVEIRARLRGAQCRARGFHDRGKVPGADRGERGPGDGPGDIRTRGNIH